MRAADRRTYRACAAVAAVAVVLSLACGCHKEETPPPSTGYYAGSDYTKGAGKGGAMGQAGRAPESGTPRPAGR